MFTMSDELLKDVKNLYASNLNGSMFIEKVFCLRQKINNIYGGADYRALGQSKSKNHDNELLKKFKDEAVPIAFLIKLENSARTIKKIKLDTNGEPADAMLTMNEGSRRFLQITSAEPFYIKDVDGKPIKNGHNHRKKIDLEILSKKTMPLAFVRQYDGKGGYQGDFSPDLCREAEHFSETMFRALENKLKKGTDGRYSGHELLIVGNGILFPDQFEIAQKNILE